MQADQRQPLPCRLVSFPVKRGRTLSYTGTIARETSLPTRSPLPGSSSFASIRPRLTVGSPTSWTADCAAWCAGGWREARPQLLGLLNRWLGFHSTRISDEEGRSEVQRLTRLLWSLRADEGLARDFVTALRARLLDALMEAEPSLSDQREQVERMSAALAAGGPLAEAQEAMKPFVEMQNRAQEAMKPFIEMQQPALEAFVEMQKPVLAAMKSFAEMQKPALEAIEGVCRDAEAGVGSDEAFCRNAEAGARSHKVVWGDADGPPKEITRLTLRRLAGGFAC